MALARASSSGFLCVATGSGVMWKPAEALDQAQGGPVEGTKDNKSKLHFNPCSAVYDLDSHSAPPAPQGPAGPLCREHDGYVLDRAKRTGV